MIKIGTILVLLMLLTGVAVAQECGPSCPVCSGSGNNQGALLARNSVMITGLSIPTAEEERTVFSARYGLFSWLDAGLGYAVRTEKTLWNVRVQPLTEVNGTWRPGIILGSGSVQTGGSDQSLYAQLVKSLDVGKRLGAGISAGAAMLLPDFDKVYGLAGVTGNLDERYSIFASYDGESFHEGVSWIPLEWLALSFLLVETEYPSIAVTVTR